MDWIGPAWALGILALAGFGIAWMVRHARRGADARASLAADVGFTRMQEPYDDLRARLAEHHRSPPDQIHIRTAHRKDAGRCILYLLDYNASTSGDSETHDQTVAAVVPGMDVPGFSVFPRVPGSGPGVSFADRVIEQALRATGARPADVSAYPAFAARYTMAFRQPDASPDELPSAFYGRMADLDWASVDGCGDMLIVSVRDPRSPARPMDRDTLARTIQAAAQLAETLMGRPKEPVGP